MSGNSYVLVTPARNEEATIGITIESVIGQTLLPLEWVIVSDQSTDSTDEIVSRYKALHPFIRLVRLEAGSERSFSSVVYAAEAGIQALQTKKYEFLGLLDADVRFGREYFETLMKRLETNPKLGLTGGLVLDVVNGKTRRSRQYLRDVAGAAQFFRRDCFESLGGLVAIPEGGWDAITCVQARANGYETATFPDLLVEHLKPRNVSEGNILRRCWQMGVRDYALGSHPLFEALKCVARCTDHPPVIGAAFRLAGFTSCLATRKNRTIPKTVAERIRGEQLARTASGLLGRGNRA